jgi:hypothetical protein
MAGTPDRYAAFRLNLEQQRKRAKDLLRAARAGDPVARQRMLRAGESASADDLKLAHAQFAIARELRFASWPGLRTHIAALEAARAAMGEQGPAPDGQMPTLHIRCGSDIKQGLAAAGFTGDFLEVWDSFTVGPVLSGADWLEQRARFHADAGRGLIDVDFQAFLAELTAAESRLAASAGAYERVVIWTEHDSHDQLSLIRCVAHYARTGPPRVLELVSVNHFPGSQRFVGLGQLPPEAMRLLWQQRVTIGAEHLNVSAAAWDALTSDDPRELAALTRTGTPALPHLGPALHRHLRELPWRDTGLSLTQALTLQVLAEQPMSIGELFGTLHREREPLPFLGDTTFLHILNEMGRTEIPVLDRIVVDPERPFRDRVAITEVGRELLRGTREWLSLQPPPRWVGGVRIDATMPNWRWDEARRDAVRG